MANNRIPGIKLDPNANSLSGGTLMLQQAFPPVILIDIPEPKGLLRRNGTWDFSKKIDFSKFNMIELIQDNNSTLYNFGPLLVKKMEEIRAEGQVYYWEMDPKKRYTKDQQRELESRQRKVFVKMGDGSNSTKIGNKGKILGDFDRLVKWDGTTNCSTAVLDALYRTLGGKVNKNGEVVKIGGVNGVPLSHSLFSGFPKKFQGLNWDDAIVEYGLGYKVEIRDLKLGDIISTGGHRMVFLETMNTDEEGSPSKIRAIQAQLPTGKIAVQSKAFSVKHQWKAARIFDIRSS